MIFRASGDTGDIGAKGQSLQLIRLSKVFFFFKKGEFFLYGASSTVGDSPVAWGCYRAPETGSIP